MSEHLQHDLDTSVVTSNLGSDEPSNETKAVEQVQASILQPLNDSNSSISLGQQDDSGNAEETASSVIHVEHKDNAEEVEDKDGEKKIIDEKEINNQKQHQDQVVQPAASLQESKSASETDQGSSNQEKPVEGSTSKTQELKEEIKKQAEQAPESKPPAAEADLELPINSSAETNDSNFAKDEDESLVGHLEKKVEEMDLVGETKQEKAVAEEKEVDLLMVSEREEDKKSNLPENSKIESNSSSEDQAKEEATNLSGGSTISTTDKALESPTTPKVSSSQLPEAQSFDPDTNTSQSDATTNPHSHSQSQSQSQSQSPIQDPERQRSLPPPPIPSKDQPSELDSNQNTSNLASIQSQPSRTSTPKGVGADPSDVAAVAAAFGRNSPRPSSASDPSKALPLPPDSSKSTPETRKSSNSGGGIKIGKGPPPASPPPEEVQFDFNKFLEQMRHKSAQPVGEYVKSFIKGFSKKPYRTSDQSKLIFDFLAFISAEMRKCVVWSKASDAEFSNAEEAMEKLVMNRLYAYTFAPAVKKEGKWPVQTDDLERDRVLSQRSEMFNWVREEHLEVPTGDHSKGFIEFAMQELVKINNYKAPRDKLICILNSCKVIFGLIRHLSSQESADTFIPVLIFVVLQANPEHLISNVEYISRFRTPERLSSESAYYLSSLMGAIAFIETMDYTSLSNITQEEFEKNVEEAVQRIGSQPRSSSPPPRPTVTQAQSSNAIDPSSQAGLGEESASALVGPSFAEDTKAFLQRTGEAARIGFTSSLGKPMGALGKFLNEGLDGIRTPGGTVQGSQSGGPGTPARNESPTPASNRTSNQNSSNTGSMRGKFLGGLFGDGGAGAGSDDNQNSIARGFNASSWSRSMRADPGDEEPETPLSSEELKQGRFGVLPSGASKGQKNSDSSIPRPPVPSRTESIDTYVDDDDDEYRVRGSGIRTPSDSGSEDGHRRGGGMSTTSSRSRLPDFNSFVPSFLSETPSRPSQPHTGNEQPLRRGPVSAVQRQDYYQNSSSPQRLDSSSSFVQSSSFGPHLQDDGRGPSPDESQLADLSAEFDRAHEMQMGAGIETLKSIFPGTEKDVCQMVLENCNGDVQAAIDQLLEMS